VTTGTETAVDNNELGSLRINERDSDFAEITSVTPNNASQGDTITINIAGSSVEFINNQSAVKFGDTGIEVLSTTVTSPTQATAEIKIANNALLGTRDVYVTTGSEIATKLAGFAVFSPASISLNTNQGQQNSNVQLMITGDRTNFEQNVTQINFGGDGITSSITVINQTIIANVQIANDAELTTRNISVVTGEEIVALFNAFTVIATPPGVLEVPEPSIIELTEKTKEVAETGNVIITVKRTDSNVGKVTVKYSTTSASAKAGEDFTAIDNMLTWEDGDNKDKEITISILDDKDVEENETFTLKLFEITGNASLGLSEMKIAILNDDVDDKVVEPPVDKKPVVTPKPPVEEKPVIAPEPPVLPVDDTSKPTDSTEGDAVNPPATETKSPVEEEKSPTDNNGLPSKDIEENVVVPPKSTPVISYAPACPDDSSEIDIICIFNRDKMISDILTTKKASVSSGILVGKMENRGWVSNLTIQEGGELTGGFVTGYIKNNGIMTNFDFRGASIIGGTLGGVIINNSPITGIFEDVYLEADTRIIGGKLTGYIIGDPNQKALLEHLVITGNGILKNVIIGERVKIADTVMIDESVEFIQR
ncbi:Calx-beta domain-containing protein, partial [Thiotrichales bacterium HSG1]|nr:Calx-beta domain-containing protein [Thiotrichales bacterium HSG1]